nr:TupA-like ATPgrasp [uncultured bacterium]
MSFRDLLQRLPARNDGKISGKTLAASVNVPHAETIGVFDDPRDILTVAANRSLVVKPEYGCSSRGVLALYTVTIDTWNDLIAGIEVDSDDIMESIDKSVNSPRNQQLHDRGHPDFLRGPWIAEELVLSPDKSRLRVADDVKVFCINGTAALIGVFRRHSRPSEGTTSDVAWFDAGGDYLGDAHRNPKHYIDPDMQSYPDEALNGHWGGLLEYAERVAEASAEFFVRVDFFAAAHGPVFSEVTYKPAGGNVDFRPDVDQWLKMIWEYESIHGLFVCS